MCTVQVSNACLLERQPRTLDGEGGRRVWVISSDEDPEVKGREVLYSVACAIFVHHVAGRGNAALCAFVGARVCAVAESYACARSRTWCPMWRTTQRVHRWRHRENAQDPHEPMVSSRSTIASWPSAHRDLSTWRIPVHDAIRVLERRPLERHCMADGRLPGAYQDPWRSTRTRVQTKAHIIPE